MTTTVQSSTAPSQTLLTTMNGTTTTTSSTDAEEDKFMTLLITQMQNQDPLNPMDNAEVTSQLAQLNTVTGINQLNSTLESFIGDVQSAQSYQASSMIGHDVLVSGNTITTSDTGGYFAVDLPTGADKISVDIKDKTGSTVRTLSFSQLATGTSSFAWDGKNETGTQLAADNYTFEVKASTGTSTVTANPLNYSQVISISNSTTGIQLNLSNLDSVKTSDVKEIF